MDSGRVAQFFEINHFLFTSLTKVDVDVVSNVFLWMMVALFLFSLGTQIRARMRRRNPSRRIAASQLSALGVLGTFVGVAVGLATFDVSKLDESIPRLLEGLKVAFSTSIFGMLGSTGLTTAQHVMFVMFPPSGGPAGSQSASSLAASLSGVAISDDAHLLALRLVDADIKANGKLITELRTRIDQLNRKLDLLAQRSARPRIHMNEPPDSGIGMSLADLMSGLMIIFMFIAIGFMRHEQEKRSAETSAKEAAVRKAAEYGRRQAKALRRARDWISLKATIYRRLEEEFSPKLKGWGAKIDPDTLAVQFQEPSVLFRRGSATLPLDFKLVLTQFFPTYVGILRQYGDAIAEIRIEGHTSSEWTASTPPREAHRKNQSLSQERAGNVLEFCMSLTKDVHFDWLRTHIMAAGFSSGRVLKDAATQAEQYDRSRRVDFRVRTIADEELTRIARDLSGDSLSAGGSERVPDISPSR